MLERYFELSKHGTNVRTELLAGLTTFLTMAYIIFLQPMVLSGKLFGQPNGMDEGAVMTAMANLVLEPMIWESDTFSSLIVGKTVDGVLNETREVRVKLKRLSESTTEVSIWIVFTRDQNKLQQIHDEIRKVLAGGA